MRGTPDNFPGHGPAKISEAYAELTHHGFAVWMRLMVATDDELRAGRRKMARLLGYGDERSNGVLRELKRKGYISFIVNDPGLPTQIVIERRALITSKARFVRLS